MAIYIVHYSAYGNGTPCVSSCSFVLRKDAEQEAKELRSCGHTAVKVVKTLLKTKKS